jgi:chemotaxis protein histidine kinase CheA
VPISAEPCRLRRAAPARASSAPAPAAPARCEKARRGGRRRAKRVMRDDIDAQLLPIFLEEAQLLLPQIGSDLRDWKANPQDEKVLQSLQRAPAYAEGQRAHGGRDPPGELTHIMEGRVEAALEAEQFDDALFVELEEKMDRLSLDIERMAARGPCEERPRADVSSRRPQAVRRARCGSRSERPRRRAEAPLPRRRRCCASRRHARPPDQRSRAKWRSRARASRPSCARSSSRRDLSEASRACAASCARSRCRPTARCVARRPSWRSASASSTRSSSTATRACRSSRA